MTGAWGEMPHNNNSANFGNFNQCRNMMPLVASESMTIRSQYCLLNSYFNNITLDSRDRHVTLGICIPDSCPPTLIAALVTQYVDAKAIISIEIPVESCQLHNDNTQLLPLDIIMM